MMFQNYSLFLQFPGIPGTYQRQSPSASFRWILYQVSGSLLKFLREMAKRETSLGGEVYLVVARFKTWIIKASDKVFSLNVAIYYLFLPVAVRRPEVVGALLETWVWFSGKKIPPKYSFFYRYSNQRGGPIQVTCDKVRFHEWLPLKFLT